MLSNVPIAQEVLDYFLADKQDENFPRLSAFRTLGVVKPNMVRQHFLFYHTLDVFCFCQLHPKLLELPGSNVFSVLGNCPNVDFLLSLKNKFPNAKLVGVFDDDLFGKVLDCKVALWQMGRDASFRLDGNQILVRYRDRTFSIAEPLFSLHRFKIMAGIRSNYRTIKPKGTISFARLLAQNVNP